MGELVDPCEGTGWVCETHHTVPWRDGDNCCGAPGMPCLVCNGGDPPRFPPGSLPVWDFKNDPPGPRVWSRAKLNDFSEPKGVYHFAHAQPGAAEAEIEKAREAGVLDTEVDRRADWQHTDHGTIVRDLIEQAGVAWSSEAQPVTKESLQESVDRAMEDFYDDLGIRREEDR